MKLLTKKHQESYENTKFCYISKKSLKINMLKLKNIEQLGMIVIVQVKIKVLHISHINQRMVYLN